MAYYRIGSMIRLAREAVGMTREEAAEGICSVQTLYRIESGKCKIKKSTYIRLMEKLGRYSGKNYAVFSSEDVEAMEEKARMNQAVVTHDYKKAYEHLCNLEKKMDDSIVNRQSISTQRASIYRHLGKITQEEALEICEKAIALTIPDYKQFLGSAYPFTDQEYIVLMNIVNVSIALGNDEKAIEVGEMVLRSLDLNYMSRQEVGEIKICIKHALGSAYINQKKYQRAHILLEEARQESKEQEYGVVLPTIFGGLACVVICQIEEGNLDESAWESCKRYIRQGYFLSAACKNEYGKEYFRYLIEDYLKEEFDEYLGLPV